MLRLPFKLRPTLAEPFHLSQLLHLNVIYS